MTMYRQLWLAIVASMLLALGGSLLASMLSARGYLESQLSIKNTDNATALALSLSQSNPDPVSAELTVSALFDSGHYELIRINDPNGKVMVERTAPVANIDVPAWFARFLPIRATPGEAQISTGWKQFGTVTLISHSRFAYHALWNSALQMLLALSLACTFAGYLGSLILRRLRAPLNAVIDQATAITERRFVTIEEPRVPELRQLASAMNTTVSRLKTMFAEEAARLDSVRREANCDSLTGLDNRDHFLARLRQMLDTEEVADGTLILIRLSRLKETNALLGRAATDEFVQRIAHVLDQSLAQYPDSVLARLNGGDFAAALPGMNDGTHLTERLLADLGAVTATYGITETAIAIGYGRFLHGMGIGGLMARIDLALANAELRGVNAIANAPLASDSEAPRSADEWRGLIQQALDKHWVRLVSFPVAAFAGHLMHREAPLRLMFTENGEWLPAGHFLPFAERLQLMPDLDLAALSLALEELDRQPATSNLAINLSAASIGNTAFCEALIARLQSSPQSAARLWLEVAESGAINRLAEFRALCLAIQPTGCRVGLEHFGHHLNQISQWHDLGLDYIKVDPSFVRNVDANPGNQAYLKGLASIAHGMGLLVIAEGVASENEMNALKAIGFDGATGPAVIEPNA